MRYKTVYAALIAIILLTTSLQVLEWETRGQYEVTADEPPQEGPGSLNYDYDMSGPYYYDGNGNQRRRWWIFEPSGYLGEAPVLALFHGSNPANQSYTNHKIFLEHLAKKGYIVIYPAYQPNYDLGDDDGDGVRNWLDYDTWTQNYYPDAMEAFVHALNFLYQDPQDEHVDPDLSKVNLMGHSCGGGAALYQALFTDIINTKLQENGTPEEVVIKTLIPVESNYPLRIGFDDPWGTCRYYEDLDPEIRMLCLTGEEGSGKIYTKQLFVRTSQIPLENKDYIHVMSDYHGTDGYDLIADHGFISSKDDSEVDNLDYWAVWKLAVGLMDHVCRGGDSKWCLGGGGEMIDMGNWSDNTSVRKLIVIDTPYIKFSFSEGTGTSTVDDPRLLEGQIHGADWVASPYGYALQFNSSELDYLNVPEGVIQESNSPKTNHWLDFHLTGNADEPVKFTLEAWVKPISPSEGNHTILEKSKAYYLKLITDASGNTKLGGGIFDEGLDYSVDTGANYLNIDTWTHIAFSYDGNYTKLYINGKETGNTSHLVIDKMIDENDNDLYIGCSYDDLEKCDYFDGIIDEVALYDYLKYETPINMPLHSSWNLISIPLRQLNTSINAVLESIAGKYDKAQSYDAFDASDHWRYYNMNKPSCVNDLVEINHTMGFWLHMTENGTLSITGEILGSVSIPLYKGWNLVGCPSLTNRTVENALSGIPYGKVEGFDENNPPYYLKTLIASDWMEAGNGYWIYAKENCTWTIEN